VIHIIRILGTIGCTVSLLVIVSGDAPVCGSLALFCFAVFTYAARLLAL
jgi:hypothetical protein